MHLSYFWSTASRRVGQRFSITPYITPRLTPTGTPKIISTSGSPRGYSAVGSPQKTSGTTSPTKPPYEGRTILSSWYPSSQQSSAANSPPRGRPQPGFLRVIAIWVQFWGLLLLLKVGLLFCNLFRLCSDFWSPYHPHTASKMFNFISW